MDWFNEKKTDQYAKEKRRVFSFDLTEEREDKCLTERGKRVPDHRSDVLKRSLPQDPSAHPRNTDDSTEYLKLIEDSKNGCRDEDKKKRYGGAVPETNTVRQAILPLEQFRCSLSRKLLGTKI